MPASSTATPCPPNLKWQWADSGWITGDDRVKFVLGLNRGSVRGFHEQEGELGNRRMRICGAPEILEAKPKHGRALAPTWTGTIEHGPSSLRSLRASPFGTNKEKASQKSHGEEDKKREQLVEGKKRQFERGSQRGPGATAAAAALERGRLGGSSAALAKSSSSSLPSLLPAAGPSWFQAAAEGSGTDSGPAAAQPDVRGVSFQIPPATPSLPPESSRSIEPPPSEKSGLKVMAAPCLMNLYDELNAWRPKWAPQPMSVVRYQRGPQPPARALSPTARPSAEELQEQLNQLKGKAGGGVFAVPKQIRLEHQTTTRCTAFDFAGCIHNPNPKLPHS